VPAGSLTLGDVIRRFGPALLHQRGATLTPAQHAVLSTLGRCHTAALGGHLYRCDHCGAERPAYHSCGNRHCPSCLGHRSAQWLVDRQAELLPVPYFHVVFTVPEEMAALALGNKKVVYSILFRAASEALLHLAEDPRHLGACVGFLAILHTWTQTLLHHPHLHCIVPAGGLSPDRRRWIPTRPGFLLPIRVLSQLFRGKFLAFLTAAAAAGELRFAGVTGPLADPSAFAAFLREQRQKQWVVYAKPPFGSPEQVLKYLARYTHRVAISDARLLAIHGDTVTFRYRDRTDDNRQREMTLDGVELLRRFLLHVLPTGFVRIRYYGLLANRVRADNLARCRELLSSTPMPPRSPTSLVPLESAHEDRHRCPACGTGLLRRVGTLDPVPLPGLDAWPPTPRDTS
jgi:predicted RNA-binding Zn-ribbon protein involved in translation (DUF1610 family)